MVNYILPFGFMDQTIIGERHDICTGTLIDSTVRKWDYNSRDY